MKLKFTSVVSFLEVCLLFTKLTVSSVDLKNIDEKYNKSWIEYTEQQIKQLHPFHSNMAAAIVTSHMLCRNPMANAAAFGVTLYTDKETKVFQYNCTITSGETKSIVKNNETVKEIMTSINSINRGYTAFFEKILEFNSFFQTKDIISFLREKNNISIEKLENDKTFGRDINSFLHCEQVFIINLLLDEKNELIQKIRNNTNIDGIIKNITFDIVTYNDICPKCFSTCIAAFKELKSKICTAFKADNAMFKIVISSFRPYKISDDLVQSFEKKFSRGLNSEFMDDSLCTQYIRNKTVQKTQISDILNKVDEVEQFVNPFFLKEESKLSLKKEVCAIKEIKNLFHLPIAICKEHIRQLSALLQYFKENNMPVGKEELNNIKNFFQLISPDIKSIAGELYSANASIEMLLIGEK